MSESAPPGVPEPAAERPAQALTLEAIDSLLADFRGWLEQLSSGVPDRDSQAPPPPGREPIDLHTLLGQFIAVRHEVNLQTKAVRAQQEQSAETLRVLAETVEELRRSGEAARDARQQSGDEQARPLLKALVDLHDALSLAARQAERVRDDVLPALPEIVGPPPALPLDLSAVDLPPLTTPPQKRLARLFGVRPIDAHHLADWRRQACAAFERAAREQHEKHAAVQEQRYREAEEAAERVRTLLTSLVAGYQMGLQRVERALQQQGLEPIAAVGERFDPELMEALEAVDDSGQPTGEVLGEVRRGYLWRGRVFRYAQVRVARS